MKKLLTTILFTTILGLTAYSQSALVGWDFSNLGGSGLAASVDGFSAERTYQNNGFQTGGSLSDAHSSASFSANGAAASGIQQSSYGFSTTTTADILGSETGQQSLNFFGLPAAGTDLFTINFNSATDVKLYFDHAGASNQLGIFLNFAYKTAGSDTFTAVSHKVLGSGSNSWASVADGGVYSLVGQTNGILDLSSSGEIDAIKFIADNSGAFGGASTMAGNRIGIDNILVTGTATQAIPEPSTYALILGLIALIFASRRN
ncbi:MAG: PEP-CTERM sorting domain-containing protein [Balneolaceae bacterium]|nr:PEP-CTERM sorting domain-containing protein [Balneolaceae bacterium]